MDGGKSKNNMSTPRGVDMMNAYVWCWSKACGSLEEMGSLVIMGSGKSKILNEFQYDFNSA